ncbi:MAG: bifunctional riboflavin kinase/FAD synthetase [Hyphomicrobiales bacterium]|nr:bifunctional riboflavin kinase/FAD synthetase [Hyphomicrobiales bacterium]
MDVVRDHTDVPDRLSGAVLAIGNFDGVHRGHQAVLLRAIEIARDAGTLAGAMVFEPHPRQFFQPDVPLFRLTPEPLKLELFEAFGLDIAVVLGFDAGFAGLAAEDFIGDVLHEGLGVRHVVTGYDFQFGRGRLGTPELLTEMGQRLGFGVTVVEATGEAGGAFSSSRVRQLLQDGSPEAAAEILGYWWRIAGTVAGGAKRGGGLGFPTANFPVADGMALKHGIYAVRVFGAGSRFDAAAYLGTRPTFDDGKPVFEVFLFDFNGDLYGQEIELELIAYLREDARFDSAEDLKAQMQLDCARAREAIARVAADDPMARFPLGRRLEAQRQG